jgi:hypothetical protein
MAARFDSQSPENDLSGAFVDAWSFVYLYSILSAPAPNQRLRMFPVLMSCAVVETKSSFEGRGTFGGTVVPISSRPMRATWLFDIVPIELSEQLHELVAAVRNRTTPARGRRRCVGV